MHTNRRLFDLATQNAQRKALQGFLPKQAEAVHSLFDEATRVFHPDISDLTARAISRASELQKTQPQTGATTKIHYTSSRDKAVALLLDTIAHLPNGKYLMVAGGGNGVSLGESSFWVSTLPGNYVALPEANSQIEALLQSTINELVLVAVGFESAVILETVGGYLPEEPSADEVIYELSAWGLHV